MERPGLREAESLPHSHITSFTFFLPHLMPHLAKAHRITDEHLPMGRGLGYGVSISAQLVNEVQPLIFCRGHAVHCRKFSDTPGLHSLDAGSPSQV